MKRITFLLFCISVLACSKNSDQNTINLTKADLVGDWNNITGYYKEVADTNRINWHPGISYKNNMIISEDKCIISGSVADACFNEDNEDLNFDYSINGNIINLTSEYETATIKIREIWDSGDAMKLECNGYLFNVVRVTLITGFYGGYEGGGVYVKEGANITANTGQELIDKLNALPNRDKKYDLPLAYKTLRIKGALSELPHFSTFPETVRWIDTLDISETQIKKLKSLPIVKRIILPNQLEDLQAAFYSSGYIKEMTIPASVRIIHDYNFFYNLSLESVHIKAITPPEILYAEELYPEEASRYPRFYPEPTWKLYVPKGTKSAYESHDWWGRFYIIIEE